MKILNGLWKVQSSFEEQVYSYNQIEVPKSHLLVVPAAAEENISVAGEVVFEHDPAIKIGKGDIQKVYGNTLTAFLKLKARRRCRAI